MGYKNFGSDIMGNNFFLPLAGNSRVRLGLLCRDPELEQVNVTGGRLLVW